MIANVLSIAGSDPSGGAGIQADLKTFAALGCNGMAVATALTAQSGLGVQAVHIPPPEFLAAQLSAIFDDMPVDAVKIGMLANGDNARIVAQILGARAPQFVVLDPVLAASSGHALARDDLVAAIMHELLPVVDLLTPNAPEAARLSGLHEATDLDGLRRLGYALRQRGARAVLMKGGHINGAAATDILIDDSGEALFTSPWIETRHTHGTGCTLSSAIAASVARGETLSGAIAKAKDYLTGAMQHGHRLQNGSGQGPLNHFWRIWPGN